MSTKKKKKKEHSMKIHLKSQNQTPKQKQLVHNINSSQNLA